jgi:hypothetical protein
MKKFAGLFVLLVCSALLLSSQSWAGTAPDAKEMVAATTTNTERIPLDIFEVESGYVFESDLNHGGSFGKQDELQTEIEYARRFLLTGNTYLHLGLSYDRFDFGRTSAPVPTHLQSFATVVGIDFMHGNDVGAFIQFRPGFYTEEHLGFSSFDAPVTVARVFVLQPDKLYLFAGVNASLLRGTAVVPLLGAIYIPCKQWRFMGVLPEPRIVYSPNENLDLWIGGELASGSFRTDHQDSLRPKKLSGTQVDYDDYRAGVGLAYSIKDNISFDVGAGYAIQRSFNFHRAGEYYRTDPAPYLRLEFKAKF